MVETDRPIKEKTRAEIEKNLSVMGDYVQMSYLQRALKSRLNFETKKFVLLRLGGIYESKKMFIEAAKMIKAAAEINTTFKDKNRDFMRAVELYIKGGNFIEADRIFAQSLTLGNSKEKQEMKDNFKNFYLAQARNYERLDKRNQAKITYEKLLTLELDIGERNNIQKKLLDLYEKLGDVKSYFNLKKSV